MEHSLTAPQTAGESYNYQVYTKYEDSTKWFPTMIQAIDYLNNLDEEGALWDYSTGNADFVCEN